MTNIDPEFYYNSGTLLKGVNMPDPDLIISSNCLEIYGNSASDYCFLHSKETLRSFRFDPSPQLTTIGKYSFYNCSKLQRIDLSMCTKLTIIGESAFSYCTSVTELFLPEGLQYIKNNAFSQTSIQSVEIPTTVIDILDFGLGIINTLTSITFKEGSKLRSLSNNAFAQTKLVEFKVPESVQSIVGTFVGEVDTLTIIRVHQNNKYFISDNYAVYTKDYSQILVFAANSNSTYNINPKVTSIKHGAFAKAKCTSITIPPSVTLIEGYAFYFTSNLKQITLPPNITAINDYCFYCSGLTSIDIPEKVTRIGIGAFAGCNFLKTFVLPGNLTEVGGGAFPPNPNINFIFKGDSQIKIDNQMLMMAKDNSSISLLLDASATSIKIPSQVKRIKLSTFKDKKN